MMFDVSGAKEIAAKEKTMDKMEQVKPIDGDLSSGQGIVPPHARW